MTWLSVSGTLVENGLSRKYNLDPAKIYLFKVNNKNTTKMCEICLKLAIKTPERRQ